MPGKREVTLLLLEKGTVYVHLDARRSGVELPLWLKNDSHVVLQFGTSPTFPVRDFRLDDERIAATLFFQGVPHLCVVPWSAVFAIVSADNRGMAWPDDVPPDIPARPRGEGARRPTVVRRPGAARMEASPPSDEPRAHAQHAAVAGGARAKRPLPSYLRVVK